MSDVPSQPDMKVVPDGRRRTKTVIRRRALLVEQTMMGATIPDIASKLKITERHVRRLLAEPAVREQIKALDDETLRVVSRRAAAFATGAVTTLVTIMASASTPPSARVSAAGKVLDTMIRVAELSELSGRIERLEAQFSPGGMPSWRPRAP